MKRRFKTDILVRNNRIEQMENLGLNVNYKVLSDEEYLKELKNKIVEEANEVAIAENVDELSSEIGDVLEVIEHMAEAYNLDMDIIQQKKREKQNKIGKFDKKYKTFWIEMDENNGSLDYYLSKPEKYPEIPCDD